MGPHRAQVMHVERPDGSRAMSRGSPCEGPGLREQAAANQDSKGNPALPAPPVAARHRMPPMPGEDTVPSAPEDGPSSSGDGPDALDEGQSPPGSRRSAAEGGTVAAG